MNRKRRLDVGVRMSKQELIIVSCITRQLAGAYCNAAGKPEYARNLDQVMEDIFGVKKFTKTLERGIHDEATMIALMRQLDIDTIWHITRNSNHYRMLCALVAMDSEIVRISKKMDKIIALDPTERPSGKYQKLRKQLKELRKKYRHTVKIFRDIFDIKKAGSGSVAGLLDVADDWMDRFSSSRRGDSIFDIFDYDDGSYAAEYGTESMDEYVRKMSGKVKGGKVPRREGSSGAFGILNQERRMADEEDSIYDGYFGDEDSDSGEDSEDTRMDALEDAIKAIAEHVGKLTTAVATGKPMTPPPEPDYHVRPRTVSRPRGFYEPEEEPTVYDADASGQDRVSWAIERNTAAVDKLVGALAGMVGGQNADDGSGGFWESPPIEIVRPQPIPADDGSVSVEEALRMAEPEGDAADGPTPGAPIVMDEGDEPAPSTDGDTINT